jgi:hypothetical protein
MGTRQMKKSEQRRANSRAAPRDAAPVPPSGLRHPSGITDSMHQAVLWLKKHGGSGIRCKPNRMLAGGEYAPFMFETFERLKTAGLVAIDGFRWVITDRGRAHVEKYPA